MASNYKGFNRVHMAVCNVWEGRGCEFEPERIGGEERRGEGGREEARRREKGGGRVEGGTGREEGRGRKGDGGRSR